MTKSILSHHSSIRIDTSVAGLIVIVSNPITQRTQGLDGLNHACGGLLDFIFGVEAAEAEAEAGAGLVVGQADGSQDVAGFGVGG